MFSPSIDEDFTASNHMPCTIDDCTMSRPEPKFVNRRNETMTRRRHHLYLLAHRRTVATYFSSLIVTLSIQFLFTSSQPIDPHDSRFILMPTAQMHTHQPGQGPSRQLFNASLDNNPFLPDYSTTTCKNDKLAEPWMDASAITYLECCNQFFSWNLMTCFSNSQLWLVQAGNRTSDNDGRETVQKYYADTSEGICKVDSPSRPLWFKVLETTFSQCCKDYFPWNLEKCLAADPFLTSENSENNKYYPDTTVGYCVVDGPSRPAWVETVFNDYAECCTTHFSWNFVTCLTHKPPPISKAPSPLTSMPTPPNPAGVKPTAAPTSSFSTSHTYYPDYFNNICKTDDGYSEFEVNFFKSLEDCCKFPWIDYDICMKYSITSSPTKRSTTLKTTKPTRRRKTQKPTTPPNPSSNSSSSQSPTSTPSRFPTSGPTQPPTSGPSRFPTSRPTQPPTSGPSHLPTSEPSHLPTSEPSHFPTSRPTQPPTSVPSQSPTYRPVSSNPTNVHTGDKVFYPDLILGVCKSDGKHGNIPYQFSSAEACCDNTYMDYAKCIAYALSKRFYPDVPAGLCRVSNGMENSVYIYDNVEECCNAGLFQMESCISLSLNGDITGSTNHPTSIPTVQPSTKKPVGPSQRGFYYPDFPAGYCKSDGHHENKPYVFITAEKCCKNAVMNYDECIILSVENYGGPTEYSTTSHPTPQSSIKPTSTPIKLTPQPTLTITTTVAATSPPTIKPSTILPSSMPIVSPIKPGTIIVIDKNSLNEVTDGFENGLNGLLPWNTSQAKPWTIDNTQSVEGVSSARSSPISRGENSVLSLTIDSEYGGKFYFSIKSDIKMPYSGFYINLDDISKLGYTYQTSSWINHSLAVEPGQHRLSFRTWAPNVASVGFPNNTGTVNVDYFSFQPILVENFETKELKWNSFEFLGTGNWTFDNAQAHGGNISLRSPSSLKAGQYSSMNFELTAPRKGSVLNFWYLVDISNPNNRFKFKFDGTMLFDISSKSNGWEQRSVSIPPGKHMIIWEFIIGDDSNVNDQHKAAWIDDITIVPIG